MDLQEYRKLKNQPQPIEEKFLSLYVKLGVSESVARYQIARLLDKPPVVKPGHRTCSH